MSLTDEDIVTTRTAAPLAQAGGDTDQTDTADADQSDADADATDGDADATDS